MNGVKFVPLTKVQAEAKAGGRGGGDSGGTLPLFQQPAVHTFWTECSVSAHNTVMSCEVIRLVSRLLLLSSRVLHVSRISSLGEGKKLYRIAGKFGGEFNLAAWRLARAPPNLITAKFYICQNFVNR